MIACKKNHPLGTRPAIDILRIPLTPTMEVRLCSACFAEFLVQYCGLTGIAPIGPRQTNNPVAAPPAPPAPPPSPPAMKLFTGAEEGNDMLGNIREATDRLREIKSLADTPEKQKALQELLAQVGGGEILNVLEGLSSLSSEAQNLFGNK